MHIKKIIIQNFKCFDGQFSLDLNSGLNILVGDNEVGKSTILEAINLALTGWICGRYLKTELNESFFNKEVVKRYLKKINNGESESMPQILIELYCDFSDDAINAEFTGEKNLQRDRNEAGFRFSIFFDEEKSNEFISEIRSSKEDLLSLPIEYCDFSWEAFSRIPKIPKTIPLKSSLIDSSSFRYTNGSDISASRIIQDKLTPEEVTKISQAHRKLKEKFSQDSSVLQVNSKIQQDISDKRVTLQIETSTKTSWESSLVPYLDDVPFQNVGKGEQCLVKTKLSLQHKKTSESNVLLIEEPENHLSHSKLNELISYIKKQNNDKQIIISTHNSFVANKLGLGSLILLNVDDRTKKRNEFKVNMLDGSTQRYFEKLSGYDTLRLILCRKAILVEGDSDELIVQKAFFKIKQKLPIEDRVDVICVRGLAFVRFLDIAKALKQPTVVVTDNDGNFQKNITDKYKDFSSFGFIKICSDPNESLRTLEYHIVEANKTDLSLLRTVLRIEESDYPDEKSIIEYMVDKHNKTECALKIFEAPTEIQFPQYILDAVNWEYGNK